MILGHSELPPLSLEHKPMQIFASHITNDILLLLLGGKRPYLDPAICRALAKHGAQSREAGAFEYCNAP